MLFVILQAERDSCASNSGSTSRIHFSACSSDACSSRLRVRFEAHRVELDRQAQVAKARWIREVLPEFEAQGVTLGLENYEKHSCRDLAALVRRLESSHVGICLDTVNSLGALETPEVVVETLAPLTVNLHIKDFAIDRVPQMMGFVVSGVPRERASWLIPWLLGQMPVGTPCRPFWSSGHRCESQSSTIAMEQEWAERGVQYLRACGCT